ncbi:MAG: 2-hydroxyacyl-CoA dehydratase family protein [Candidatus Anammoxibacter sp.]
METLVSENILPLNYPANLDNAIGITTTVPIEIIFAAGYVPIDLNNVFISSADPFEMVDDAELKGLPRNTCAWTKGIYSAAKMIEIKEIIGVVQGDCTHTHALMDIFHSEGIGVIPFEYPYKRDKNRLEEQLKNLANRLGANMNRAEEMKERFDAIRNIVHEIDRMTWQEGKVTGEENHIWTVSTSDMVGDYNGYEQCAKDFLHKAKERPHNQCKSRIAYIGVPPICSNLYSFLESIECRVVFNEVQRQFSMPFVSTSLAEQYTLYTYPYDIFTQIDDINIEIKKREIDGLIFYVQNFCHRPIYEKIIRKHIDIPLITLDFDKPGPLNGAMKTRLEAFAEMLINRR